MRYLHSPQSLVVSLVLSQTGGILSRRSSLTHRFPQFPPRNLCSLVMLAVSSLIYAATDTAFFLVFVSLGLAELRILLAAPVDTCPRTPLISFCTIQPRTLCATHSLATLCLFTTSGPDPGELLGFWGSMVFHHAPIPWKGLGKQQQQTAVLSSISEYLEEWNKITVSTFDIIKHVLVEHLENLIVEIDCYIPDRNLASQQWVKNSFQAKVDNLSKDVPGLQEELIDCIMTSSVDNFSPQHYLESSELLSKYS